MTKNTYQTYTDVTPIDAYRADFIHRGAMCAAITKRYPDLAAVGADAEASLAQIDTRRAILQQAEDDQIRAHALEDVEKLDVLDAYAELRLSLAAKKYDILTLLPDSPSVLGHLGARTLAHVPNRLSPTSTPSPTPIH